MYSEQPMKHSSGVLKITPPFLKQRKETSSGNKLFIAVAGNIGTGKTTLTKMLAKKYNWQALRTSSEHIKMEVIRPGILNIFSLWLTINTLLSWGYASWRTVIFCLW